jgi:lipid II isoglutaminyl synthase (glutamine-hydrolysing)
MKPFKYYCALLTARSAIFTLRALGRNGSHLPGGLALRICPEFLKYIEKPGTIIGVTGTNGKTTVSNMIGDVLKAGGIVYANNALGSNIQEGIIVTMLDASTFWGKRKIDLCVLEIDERVSPKIFPYLQPTYLVVTNLYRDSYRRNAHVGYIADILKRSIPASTTLILNADDLISLGLNPANKRVTFGVDRLEGEEEIRDSRIKDIHYCPRCMHTLTFDFNRYHHIGKAHCENCGYASPRGDFVITALDKAGKTAKLRVDDRYYDMKLVGDNITDLYNSVTAIALLATYGMDIDTILKRFDAVSVVKSRFDVTELDDKKVIVMMAKDQNPIATSRVCDFVGRYDPNQRIAFLLMNEASDHGKASENIAFIYDTDFEYLNRPNIRQVLFGGMRYLDFIARYKLAGIPAERVDGAVSEAQAVQLVDFDRIDTVFILYGTKTEPQALAAREACLARIKARRQSA